MGRAGRHKATHSSNAAIARIATKVLDAAYEAFGAGLHLSLDVAGGALLVGAVVAAVTVHRYHGEVYAP